MLLVLWFDNVHMQPRMLVCTVFPTIYLFCSSTLEKKKKVIADFRTFLCTSYFQFITAAAEREMKLRDVQRQAPSVYENEYRCLDKRKVGGLDHVSASRVSLPRLFF